jgi:hypothetical protein
MKKEDETEVYRLTDMLKSIDERLEPSSPYHEALMKGVLALHHAFIHGHRSEIEQAFDDIGKPLSAEQISHLKRLGIEPDENNDM